MLGLDFLGCLKVYKMLAHEKVELVVSHELLPNLKIAVEGGVRI